MAHRVDPSDWAAKRARQLQHAKDLKFNRANAPDEELTLKPKTNKRPGYLDSLDQIAAKQRSSVIQQQVQSGDVFEKPLPATLAFKAAKELTRTNVAAPSPGSDALGKAMKSHKGNSPKNKAATFLDEYTPAPVQPLGLSSSRPERVYASELFLKSLRPDATEAAGLDGSDLDARRTGSSGRPLEKRRPSVPAASARLLTPTKSSHSQQPQPLSSRLATSPSSSSASSYRTTPAKSTSPSAAATTTTTPRAAASGANPLASPRTQGVVKSRLSLLKQKIRRSEGALSVGLGAGAGAGAGSEPPAQGGVLRSRTAAPVPGGGGETSPGRELRSSVSTTLSQGHAPRSAPGLARRSAAAGAAAGAAASGSGSGSGSGSRGTSRGAVANSHDFGAPPQQQQLYGDGDEDGDGGDYGAGAGAGAGSDQPQKKCPDCGRMFNALPYERHVKICAKVFMQKAKVFDSKMMRIGDNAELLALERKKAQQGQRSPSRGNKTRPGAAAAASAAASAAAAAAAGEAAAAAEAAEKKRVWKDQSEALRQAMKATREMARAVARGDKVMPAFQPSAPDPSFIPCPTCGRRFSQKAGERHIPQCANIMAKPKSLTKGSGLGGGVSGGGVTGGARGSAPGQGQGYAALSKPPAPLPGRKSLPSRR